MWILAKMKIRILIENVEGIRIRKNFLIFLKIILNEFIAKYLKLPRKL